MKTICKYCEGTGRLGFQREDCWFCGGSGYLDDLVHKIANVDRIAKMKDIRNIQYKGDLEKYFKEVEECNITNNVVGILSDMYDLIKSRK